MQTVPKASVVSVGRKVGFPVAKLEKKTKAAEAKEVKLAVKQDGFTPVEEIQANQQMIAEVEREAAEYHAAQQKDFYNKGVGRLFGDPDWFHEMKQVAPIPKVKAKKKDHTETSDEKRRPGYSTDAETMLNSGIPIPKVYDAMVEQYVAKSKTSVLDDQEVIIYTVKGKKPTIYYSEVEFMKWVDMRVTRWLKGKLEARSKKEAANGR